MREAFLAGLLSLDGVSLNGSESRRFPGIVNLSFDGVEAESLMLGLRDLAVSSGSACTSASLEPSYVLKAMGVPDALAHGSIRFSVGRFTSEADIDRVIDNVTQVIPRLRKVAG